MLVIVAHHYVVNSDLITLLQDSTWSVKNAILFIAGGGGKIGIDCFVMITGYYMCKSVTTLQKFLKLYLEVVFYNVVLNIIFAVSGYHEFSIMLLAKSVWLFGGLFDNFTGSFIFLYLTIPFLNILIRNINKMQHLTLMLLLLFGYSIEAFVRFRVDFNYFTWFCVLYVVASYLRYYPLNIKNEKLFWGITSLTVIGASVSSVALLSYIKPGAAYALVTDVNQPLALLVAVTTFMYFKNLNIPYNKWINTIASTTFGIYIIHTNSAAMRQWLWNDIIDCAGHYSIMYMICCIIAVFVICSIIDIVRQKIIETYLFQYMDNKLLSIQGYIRNLNS